jgi:hypothetical protein
MIAFKNGQWDSGKFALGVVGATLIIASMMILLKNRAAAKEPNVHVYNFGLPLFTLGWVFVVMEMSLYE